MFILLLVHPSVGKAENYKFKARDSNPKQMLNYKNKNNEISDHLHIFGHLQA